MILRPAPSPLRQPLLIYALMMMIFYCGNGDRIPACANAVAAAALAPLLAPYPTANQQSVGAPSEIFINQTTTLRCNVREYTPGYITTIFLSNFPFVFGCLSESESHYYYSVAFSDLNFPNTPVWVANRYDSVRDLASFVLSPQGPAFLETASGRRLWGSNTDGQHAVGLRLTSQGNLILFDQMNKSLWESFWEPIDLLVPGQVLNQGGMLVAGFSSHAFPTGNFVAVMRKGGLVFYENSSSKALPYYALGYPAISTTVDEIFSSPCNHTRLVLNTTSLTQVQVRNSPACKPPSSSVERSISFNGPIVLIRLEQNGAFKGYYSDHRPAYDLLKNSSRGACGIPNACGPYGICENSHCRCPGNESVINQLFTLSHEKMYLLNSTSCVPKSPITCVNKGHPGLQYLFDIGVVDFFANDFIEPSMLVDSMDACKAACLHKCSCRAAFYRRKSKQCYLHDTVMSMMAVSNSDYVGAIKLQKDEPMRGNSKMGFVVGISISTAAVVALFGLWYYYHKKKKHRRQTLSHDGDDELLACLPGQPKKLSYKELQAATGYFSQKLGVGGFGSVYKGVFPDGSFVAVKQLENAGRFTQGMTEFRNEVIALSNINHQNLVHLRGFCAECEHCLLVYEYVSNGSLDTWLFCTGAARLRPPLDWKTRLAIAVQTARGLVFLHEQCRNRILHLDIKPQNILLDENFVPKLSDFGLARLVNENKESAASRMRGTPGYMAPECLVLAEATEKSDVYSFGMVLLEIVSGRRNVDFSRLAVGESWYFPEFASGKLKEGNVIDIIDRSLLPLSSKDMAEATCVVQVAFWCIQDDPSLRPTTGKTLLMLEGYSEVAQPPLSFHFDLRFHLCTSVTPSSPSPAHGALQSQLEHGDRSAAAQGAAESRDCGDEGDSADTYSAPHSSYISPTSSHHTSPHASPKPAQSSRNSPS